MNRTFPRYQIWACLPRVDGDQWILQSQVNYLGLFEYDMMAVITRENGHDNLKVIDSHQGAIGVTDPRTGERYGQEQYVNVPIPEVGTIITHAGKSRAVTAVQDVGAIIRVWVEYDMRTERSGYEGYYEIRRTN